MNNLGLISQIKKSLVYKLLGVVSSFILIKYLIQYLGVEQYGIWAVILTFLNLVLYFDFGISNGIKNNLAKSLANNDYISGQEYISTGYVLLSCIVITLYVFFIFASFFIDWNIVFNTSILDNDYLQKIVLVVVFFTLLNLVLSIANAAFSVLQVTHLITLNQFFSQFIALFFTVILYQWFSKSLIFVAVVYGMSLTFSTFMISIIFFRQNRNLIPVLSLFNKAKSKGIFVLGTKFLLLQVLFFFIMSNDRIIISQLLETTAVAKYDIMYKYFSVLMILHTLVNAPLWPLYTKAYQENDYEFFKKIFMKLILFVLVYILMGIVLILFSRDIISLWIDTELDLRLSNLVYIFMMMITLIIFSIFAYFSNGINKTKIQFFSVLLGAAINIPLSVFFVKKLSMGLNGVLLATILSLSIFCITGFFQILHEMNCMKKLYKTNSKVILE